MLERSQQQSELHTPASISLDQQTAIIPTLVNNHPNHGGKTSEVHPRFPNVSISPVLSNVDTSLPATDDIPCVKFNSQVGRSEYSHTSSSGFMNSILPLPSSSLVLPDSSTSTNCHQNLSNPLSSHFNTNHTITNTKLPSLPHNVPTSPGRRSLQSTTLSQFTPKCTPSVTHAFHNLGPSVNAFQFETRSTIPTHHISPPRDLHSRIPLAAKSDLKHMNP